MTGWRSVGELAMTRRISLVAVCCSRGLAYSFRLSSRTAGVLDRDHRLGSESLEHGDLCVGKSRPSARESLDRADRLAILQHGHGQRGSEPIAWREVFVASFPGPERYRGIWTRCASGWRGPERCPDSDSRKHAAGDDGLRSPYKAALVNQAPVEPRHGAIDRSHTAARRSRRSPRTPAPRSVGELEITPRISLVAVCCSRVSVSSRFRASSSWNSRTFSIAMTAWSAKVWSSSTARP